MRQRIRIETGSKAPSAAGGTTWSTSSSTTRYADAITITAEKRERYQSIDGEVVYEFRFRGRPTIGMGTTRFVWLTDGHPLDLRIFKPAAPATNPDGIGRYTNVLVTDTGETADA